MHCKRALHCCNPMLTLIWGQPEGEPYCEKYTLDFQICVSYRLLMYCKIAFQYLDPKLTLIWGQPEVEPCLKKYTPDFQTFFSHRLVGHQR